MTAIILAFVHNVMYKGMTIYFLGEDYLEGQFLNIHAEISFLLLIFMHIQRK